MTAPTTPDAGRYVDWASAYTTTTGALTTTTISRFWYGTYRDCSTSRSALLSKRKGEYAPARTGEAPR